MSERPVIACYRGPDSADAVVVASLLATALGQPLVLAGAYRYDPVGLTARAEPSPDNARRATATQERLHRARRFAGPDLDVREHPVASTDIAGALADLARELDASMLVVGRDSASHVARTLIARAPCPVCVAPLSVPLPRRPLERIGVAYDGSTAARAALQAASSLAAASGAVLVALRAGMTAEQAEQWPRVAQSLCDAQVEARALSAEPAAALLDASADLDLLVCGSRGHGRSLTAILGSVSNALVESAECPVLVLPKRLAASVAAQPEGNRR